MNTHTLVKKMAGSAIAALLLLATNAWSQQTGSSELKDSTIVNQSASQAAKKSQSEFSDVIFNMLSADFNARVGHDEVVMDSLLKASLISGDWKVAQQAAYFALQKQYFNKAEEAALRWLQIESNPPQSSKARVSLSLSYVGQKRFSDALNQMTLALFESQSSKLYQEEVFLRYAQGLYELVGDNAITLYDEFLKAASQQGQKIPSTAYVMRALIAIQAQKFEEYQFSLLVALSLNKNNFRAATMLMSFYVDYQYPQTESVDTVASLFLRDNEDAHTIRLLYARYLNITNQMEKADRQLDILSVINDNDALKSSAIFLSAINHHERGEYKMVRQKLNQYLAFRPDDDKAWFLLCDIESQLNNSQAAMDACSQVTEDEYYFDAQMRIVKIMSDKNNYQEAINFLSELVLDDAKEREVVVLTIHDFHRKLKQYDEAKEVLDDAIAFNPNNIKLLYARGLWLSEFGSLIEMEKDFSQVIAQNPNHAQAYNAWGYALTERTEHYDKALSLIVKANELLPNNAYILDSLGWVYFKQRQYYKALEYLMNALALSQDAEIASHLIEAYWSSGYEQKSIELYKTLKRYFDKRSEDDAVEMLEKTAVRIGIPN